MKYIHNYQGRLKAAEKTLKKLSERNRKLILDFENHCFAEGLSVPRIVKYVHTVKNIARILGKDLDKADKEDIERLVARIEQTDYQPWTKHDYKLTIRKFYRWLGKEELVSWIKPKVKLSQKLLPEQLPTYEDVMKMVKATSNPRDKAFIMTLWESGARIGEIGNMEIKDVEFHENYTALRLNGKTGPRRIIVVLSTPYLQSWIQHHPLKNGPLWIGLDKRSYHKKISYQAFRKILQGAARKAKINKKVNPHSFRHAKLTELAKDFTEFQLSQYAGWTLNTKMASTYVHLAGRDLDEAILRHYGLVKNKKEEEKIKPKTCPRCGTINTFEAKFCSRCGLVLDVKAAIDLEEKKKKVKEYLLKQHEIIKIVEEDPELFRVVSERLKKQPQT